MNAHSSYSSCNLSFLALIEEQQEILRFDFGGAIDAVHEPLKRKLLVPVAAANYDEGLAIYNKLQDFLENLGALRLVNRAVGNLPLSGSEFPSV